MKPERMLDEVRVEALDQSDRVHIHLDGCLLGTLTVASGDGGFMADHLMHGQEFTTFTKDDIQVWRAK